MPTHLFDTNSFLRFILADIPEQANRIEKLLNQAREGKIKVITLIQVLFEIEYTLDKMYKFSKSERLDILNNIVNTPYIELSCGSKREITLGLNIFDESNISMVDAYLAAYSITYNAELVSFDAALVKVVKHFSGS